MEKITSLLYCEGAQNELPPQGGEGKIHLIGPLAKLTPMFIPSMFSFSLFINIEEIDVRKPHTFKFIFKNPEDKEVLNTQDISIPVQMNVPEVFDDVPTLSMCMDFRNVALEIEGVYTGEIYIDGKNLGLYPIRAKAVKR